MHRLIFLFLFLAILITPSFTQAIQFGGLKETAQTAGVDKTPSDINAVSGNVLAQVLSLVGVIFFILMLYAGVLWMTAAGDDKKITQAKEIILAAVIGLIIVASAYAITNFVGTSLRSPTTTNVVTP